jgi:hypothetical protein
MRKSKAPDELASGGELGIGEPVESVDPGLGRPPRTELGRLLLAARREFLESEGRFLDRDEFERELAERRGGASLDLQE